MRGEIYSLLADFAQRGKGEHLKSAAVRKDRVLPARKALKSAHIVNKSVTGSQMQVISIGKHDLTAYLLKVVGIKSSLYGGAGGNIHKYGGLHRAVRRFKFSPSCSSLFFQKLKHIYSFSDYFNLSNCLSMELFLISKATGLPWGQVFMTAPSSPGSFSSLSHIQRICSVP